MIDDPITNQDFIRAHAGFDSPVEMQILGEYGRLLNETFTKEQAFISAPLFAVGERLAGNGRIDRAANA